MKTFVLLRMQNAAKVAKQAGKVIASVGTDVVDIVVNKPAATAAVVVGGGAVGATAILINEHEKVEEENADTFKNNLSNLNEKMHKSASADTNLQKVGSLTDENKDVYYEALEQSKKANCDLEIARIALNEPRKVSVLERIVGSTGLSNSGSRPRSSSSFLPDLEDL